VSRLLAGQVVRFALVGVVNTATYYVLYLLLREPLGYLAAHVVAFALSTVGSFLLNSYVTYRTRPTWRKFALFPLTVAANFVITTVGVTLLVELFHVD
jgi:putative flippase GtrA